MGYHREPLAADPAAPAAALMTRAWSPASRLVLLVARHRPPPRALRDGLAQRGLRSVWVDGLAGVAPVAAQVSPDAIVYDAQAEAVPLACALARLRIGLDFAGALLVVAGSDAEADEIEALEHGADGLLPHPVAPARLCARLEAVLRRTAAAHDTPDTAAATDLPAGWQVDPVQGLLWRDAQQVALTDGQLHLLRCLARQAGRVVPRAQLHRQVCAPGSDPRSRTLDVCVFRLRQRLAAAGVRDLQIDAVRGRGFVLRAASLAPSRASAAATVATATAAATGAALARAV